jgi:hypothetical protein
MAIISALKLLQRAPAAVATEIAGRLKNSMNAPLPPSVVPFEADPSVQTRSVKGRSVATLPFSLLMSGGSDFRRPLTSLMKVKLVLSADHGAGPTVRSKSRGILSRPSDEEVLEAVDLQLRSFFRWVLVTGSLERFAAGK